MKYVKEFGIILIVSLVGELLNYFLPLPVPGLSFGYFFRAGGKLSEIQEGIAEFTAEGANERALISMNQQQVQQLQIDDGHAKQAIDIDSDQPFAIVLPINAGSITFYDVNGNAVEYWNHPL